MPSTWSAGQGPDDDRAGPRVGGEHRLRVQRDAHVPEPGLGVAEEHEVARAARRPAPTGVVTANRSAWSPGSEMPAAPYTDCTSEPQSHDSGPAVPGAYGSPSASIAALTAARVSAGSTSSDVGWRGSCAAPRCAPPPAAPTGTRPAGRPAGGSRSAPRAAGRRPAAVSWST